MLIPVSPEAMATVEKEQYPYKVFRFPSLGMLACPPDVPAEIFGMQLCFSISNNLPFLGWGIPGMRKKSAFIDFTRSDFDLLQIRKTQALYYDQLARDIEGGDSARPEIVVPEIFSYDSSRTGEYGSSEFGDDDTRNLMERLEKDIVQKGFECLFLYGVSGFFDRNFYRLATELKKLTVKRGTLIIITHIIASVTYSDNENVLREPLSHVMIRPSHLEGSAVFDWTWFIAPATQAIIRKVSKVEITNLPPKNAASIYANKIIARNPYLSIGHGKESETAPGVGLFYLFRVTSPIVFMAKLQVQR